MVFCSVCVCLSVCISVCVLLLDPHNCKVLLILSISAECWSGERQEIKAISSKLVLLQRNSHVNLCQLLLS